MRIKKLREKDLRKNPELTAHTIGVAYTVLGKRKNRAIQMYDIDKHELDNLAYNGLKKIFPNDCLIFKTKNGLHFISFTIIKRKRALKNAKWLSKVLNEHYALTNQLVLRVGSKIEGHHIISEKPSFFEVFNNPKKHLNISFKHLLHYFLYNGIPKEVFQEYIDLTNFYDYGITFHYYRTKGLKQSK